MLAVIGESQKLVDHLARGICPTTLVRRAEEHIIGFGERNAGALSVHLGGARDEHATRVTVRHAKNCFSPQDVRFNRVDWSLDNELYADRGGEMHNDVC